MTIEPEKAELESIPERSIVLSADEAKILAAMFERLHKQEPSFKLICAIAPVSDTETIICYSPVPAEKEAFLRLAPINPTEIEFQKQLANF